MSTFLVSSSGKIVEPNAPLSLLLPDLKCRNDM